MERLIGVMGLGLMIGLGFLLSTNREKIPWKMVVRGIALQVVLALLILKTDFGQSIFFYAKEFFTGVLSYSNEGAKFLFGDLAMADKYGFIFFVQILPTIIFTSALMGILYHVGIMTPIIKLFAWVMVKVLGTSGAESLSAAANIFAGQTEAPLVVGPFIPRMTFSELMTLMTGGMATVAGGVLASYVGMGIDAGHLLAASVMSAPAALVFAKILVPETETPETQGKLKVTINKETVNVVDAAARGAGQGIELAVNVGGMLVAFIALVALINGLLGLIGGWVSLPQLSLEWMMGYLFAPFAFIMGVPSSEVLAVGQLLGKKTMINEFVAYLDLQKSRGDLSEKSILISTYALCGFSNLSSIAIQLGGIGAIAPGRKADLAKLGVKSLIGGTLACFMTATIAGILT